MKLSELLLRIKIFLTSLSLGKRIALITLMSGMIVSFAIIIIWSGKSDYQLLYSNLLPEDASLIINRLKEQKIDYQISSNGSAILVPDEMVYETRMDFASQGLPKGGVVGFEIFDNAKLGMTEFLQNINYQRALQGELARTINGFSEIQSSRVHFIMPNKSLFIDDVEPAKCTVVVKLLPSKWLSANQITGIAHLVSSSISGLPLKNVTIVDHLGKIISDFKNEASESKINTDQLEYQKKVDQSHENRVKSMLEEVLGVGKVIVRASCVIDFLRLEKTEELYDSANKAIRSEQTLNEIANGNGLNASGIPGVVSNIQQEGTKSNQVNSQTMNKQDRSVNYEVGKTIRRIIEPAGSIKKISVAVIVDGTYKVEEEDEEGESLQSYIPRSQEEMAKLESIVKRAINFDSARGDDIEVVNINFEGSNVYEEKLISTENNWILSLKQYSKLIKFGAILLFVFFSYLFIVRPIMKWITSISVEDMELLKRLPKTVGQLESEMNEESSDFQMRDTAIKLMESGSSNPDKLMRKWLKET